ncbi:hypothetical protein GQ600_4005 [Phytophthora cactorum]|nr:hypothetical protein GQ600_4005 [Phytophthora cactorum]
MSKRSWQHVASESNQYHDQMITQRTTKSRHARRFDEIMRSLHFPNNNDTNAKNDRAWKTRPIVTAHRLTSPTCRCRIEVYCGVKQQLGNGPQTSDVKSSDHHLIVVGRLYTSVPLALELLAKNVYVVGTIQIARIGYAADVIDKRKKRPIR